MQCLLDASCKEQVLIAQNQNFGLDHEGNSSRYILHPNQKVTRVVCAREREREREARREKDAKIEAARICICKWVDAEGERFGDVDVDVEVGSPLHRRGKEREREICSRR